MVGVGCLLLLCLRRCLYLHHGLGNRWRLLLPLLREKGVEKEQAAQSAGAVAGREGA